VAAGIQTYSLPECDDDEDVEYKQQCALLKVHYYVYYMFRHSRCTLSLFIYRDVFVDFIFWFVFDICHSNTDFHRHY